MIPMNSEDVEAEKVRSLVYSHLRTRVSNDFLNFIMVVKNNLDLIDKIKFV